MDVTNQDSIQKAVDLVIQKFGRIDVLINNAGFCQVGAIEELSNDQVQQMYDVNVFGVMRMIKTVVPIMRKQKSGRIINISSIAGRLVTPVNGAYSSYQVCARSNQRCIKDGTGTFQYPGDSYRAWSH